jgi:hypothetical protein
MKEIDESVDHSRSLTASADVRLHKKGSRSTVSRAREKGEHHARQFTHASIQ